MSHITTVKSLGIRDESAIVKAIDDLKAKGINIRMERNARPRLYYSHQQVDCEYVLRLDDAQTAKHSGGMMTLDVGLQRQPDGTFAPLFDEWHNAVKGQIGVKGSFEGDDRAMAHIGQFAQAYAKHAAINAAAAQGYIVESTFEDEQGNIQLVVAV